MVFAKREGVGVAIIFFMWLLYHFGYTNTQCSEALSIGTLFFLEHAGELRIFVLRERIGPKNNGAVPGPELGLLRYSQENYYRTKQKKRPDHNAKTTRKSELAPFLSPRQQAP